MQVEPFAVQLFHQVALGWNEWEIAALTGIPVDRVRQRVKAAEGFLRRRRLSTGRASEEQVRIVAWPPRNDGSSS